MNNDLISRYALKKAFDEYGEKAKFTQGACQQLIDNAEPVEYTFEEAFQKTVCANKLFCPSRPQSKWITDRQPDKNGTYLCVVTLKGANACLWFREILSYATDLYEVDKFDFQKYRYKKKTDRAGWYDLDSEYGYIHYEDDEVVAWMELPELPEPYKGDRQ